MSPTRVQRLRRRSAFLKIGVGHGLAMVLMLAVTLLSTSGLLQLLASLRSTAHSYGVLKELEEIESIVGAAESSEREYLLTAEPVFLASFNEAFARLDLSQRMLRSLMAADPLQVAHLDQVLALIDQRRQHFGRVMALRRAEGVERALAEMRGARATVEIARFRSAFRSVERRERQIVAARERRLRRNAESTVALVTLGACLGIALVGGGGFLVRRELARRLAVQEELHRSGERFRGTFEQAAVGIGHLSTDGRWLFANRRLCEILGRPREELVGSFWPAVLEPEDRAASEAKIALLVDGSIEARTTELRLRRPDGAFVWIDSTLSVERDDEGRPEFLICVVEAINDRKLAQLKEEALVSQLSRAKELAEAASRTKSDFLASMSHELRTPLNSIIGFSEVLADGKVGPLDPRQSRYVGNILGSGRHLLLLVNDILDLARVESGFSALQCEAFDCGEVIADVSGTIQALAGPKRIDLTVKLAEALPPIVADLAKFKQILYNLLSNAVKFTPDGGKVEISAHFRPRRRKPGAADSGEVSGALHVAVADTGIGIRPEDQSRLFGEFVRIDSAYARKQQGTGLGLSLTRKLAELHGGRVWMESAGLGKGSTFHLFLPVNPPASSFLGELRSVPPAGQLLSP